MTPKTVTLWLGRRHERDEPTTEAHLVFGGELELAELRQSVDDALSDRGRVRDERA